MNRPLGRDTVISTKATTPNTMSTTKTTSGAARPTSPSTTTASTTMARKRRQQENRSLQRCSASSHRSLDAGVTSPPPEKARRRTDGSITHRSRLGDFFSNLACRLRGSSKNSDPGCHRESSRARKVISSGSSASHRSDSALPSMKREIGHIDEVSSLQLSSSCNLGSSRVTSCSGSKKRRIGDLTPTPIASLTSTLAQQASELEDISNVSSNASTGANSSSQQTTTNLTTPTDDISTSVTTETTLTASETTSHENGSVSGASGSLSTLDKIVESESEIGNNCYNAELESSSGPLVTNLEVVESANEPKSQTQQNVSGAPEISCASEQVAPLSSGSEPVMQGAPPSTERLAGSSSAGSTSGRRPLSGGRSAKDEVARLRATIQWLEEGARRLREELAMARAQLHEERRATKIVRRQIDAAVREARGTEAAKYSSLLADLKARLSQSPSRSSMDSPCTSKTELLKEENHRREVGALKNRLSEAEVTIQKLKASSIDRDHRTAVKNKEDEAVKAGYAEIRKLEVEVQTLRATCKILEEKLQNAEESARARAVELRAQHEKHEAEMSALQKALRGDTIKMVDEIQSKNREIEKLEKLINESAQAHEKLRAKEDEMMRKLRESERSQQIRTMTPRIEDKIHHDEHVVDLCKIECSDEETSATELERLKELALEQQEVIEVLRQAVKDKERKLEQLVKRRRKEEFYKQWLDLEPVAEAEEVDDDDQMAIQMHESTGSDSALGSAPSSLSPQPDCLLASTCSPSSSTAALTSATSCASGVTREAYESLLLEIDELHTRLIEEQRELALAKSQVRDLEKALLQETRGSQNSRRALSEKLRDAEEREASLVAEISELREQNELLEFRVLELEELPNPRGTPDLADSGIVSPEPIHLYKDAASARQHQHRDRAIATVIPYTSSTPTTLSTCGPEKAPLSLQESGIFEADEDDQIPSDSISPKPHLTSRTTQTEAPTPPGDSGELLQEVQRLQQLRARIIQERASCSSSSTSSCSSDDSSAPSTTSRLQQLEERLRNLESERREAKVREEELLDENYRLSERAYWLEAQLARMQIGERKEVATLTDEAEENDTCGSCGEKWRDCEARIQQLGKSELGLRQQVASLEQREAAFLETLRQADATWAKLETEYEAKLKEAGSKLEAQVENSRKLAAELAKVRLEPVERRRSGCGCCGLTGAVGSERVENRAEKQVERLDRDETDGKAKLTIEVPGCTELATEAKEELAKAITTTEQQQQQQQQRLASSPSTNAVICNDKVSSPVKRRPVIGFERNLFTPIRSRHRLTLYQEICV